MAVIAGEAGGPAAGVTRCSNHLYQLLQAASNNVLKDSQILVAPFLQSFSSASPPEQGWAGLEQTYRRVWSSLHTRTILAGPMFKRYPEFVPAPCRECVVTRKTQTISYPPRTTSAKDLYSFVARLRFSMEDLTQLLSASVASYCADPASQDKERPNQSSNSRVDWGGVSHEMIAILPTRARRPRLHRLLDRPESPPQGSGMGVSARAIRARTQGRSRTGAAKKIGSSGRTRTYNPPVNSRMLYQLSY